MKVGLVLEGGAMRGLFTAGVLDTFLKQKIKVDGVIGVSAGAAFGVNYKSHQIGRTLRYNLRFAGDPNFASWKSLFKTGDLYNSRFDYHQIPEKLDPFDKDQFAKNPLPFYCVVSNLETGLAEYHELKTGGYADCEWIRASASIPVFSKPVHLRGNLYWDGGVCDPIPIKQFQQMGYEKNIVVLTQPADYQKSASKIQPVVNHLIRQYPKIVQVLKTRAQDYNAVLQYLASEQAAGRVLLIRPTAALNMKTIEKDQAKLQAAYEMGVEVASKQLNEIKAFIN